MTPVYSILHSMLLTPSLCPLGIFCAPVLGIREAILIAITAVLLFGLPVLAIIRRHRRQEEMLESRRKHPELTSSDREEGA